MSVDSLKKYSYLYSQADCIKNVGTSFASAILLGGEDDDGLKVLSRIVAARLTGIPDERAFDEHADIIVYPRPNDEKKAKSKSGGTSEKQKRYAISVDDIREIIDSLYLTPFELKNKVYIIENAESMSEICQNKLLKSLEEPPARVCFVLCSSGRLLPTVESRCNRIELAPFDISVVERELNKFHNDSAAVKLAAQASRGNLGLAERILADSGFADTYASAKKLLALSTGSKMFAHAAAVYEKLSRDKVDAMLGVTEYLLNDIARYIIGADTVFDAKDVAEISGGYTPYSAALAAEAVRQAKQHNAANCMPQAVMDTLILKIMEVKAQCQR